VRGANASLRLDAEDHGWFVEVRVFFEFSDGTERETVKERRTAHGWPAPDYYEWENPSRGSWGFYEYDEWDETYYGWTSTNGGMWRVYVPR